MGGVKHPWSSCRQIRYYYKRKIYKSLPKLRQKSLKKSCKLSRLKSTRAIKSWWLKKSISYSKSIQYNFYGAKNNLKSKSYYRYKVSLNHLAPFLGNSKLQDISIKQIVRYRKLRNKVVSHLSKTKISDM